MHFMKVHFWIGIRLMSNKIFAPVHVHQYSKNAFIDKIVQEYRLLNAPQGQHRKQWTAIFGYCIGWVVSRKLLLMGSYFYRNPIMLNNMQASKVMMDVQDIN